MKDDELLQAARLGDLNSFNRLVLTYQDLVYNQAFRMLGEADAAEDATQDAFISAFHHIKTFRGGSFRAWLLRIVTNICYDELRRQKRQPITSLEPFDKDGDEIESPSWIADNVASPEEIAEQKELQQAIQRCIDQLPPEFKAVVVLVDVQGLDYFEAAEVLRKPLGTIKSRLARARMRLRECLQIVWELLPDALRQDRSGF